MDKFHRNVVFSAVDRRLVAIVAVLFPGSE